MFHGSVPEWLICKPIGDRWIAVLFFVVGWWSDAGMKLAGEDFEEIESDGNADAE